MKRVFSLLVAVALVLGLTTVSLAKENDYVLGFSSGSDLVAAGGSVNLDTIRPDTSYGYLILKEGPADAAGKPTYVHVDKTEVKNQKLDVKLKTSKGSNVIDKVEIKYDAAGNAYIEVSFVKKYISVNEQDVDLTVYLTQNKNRLSSSEVTIYGTMENYSQSVYAGYDSVYTYDVPVVEAEDYIRRIKIDMGSGIAIHARMTDGKKYYASASREIRSADADIANTFPSIESIYYLATVNLASASNTIEFERGDRMYVYNTDLEYIGTTDDLLPYYTKYYLSSEVLDEEKLAGINPGDSDGDGDGDGDGGEGDGDLIDDAGSGTKGSGNPDTGDGSFTGIALALCLASLAAAGIAARKRI